MAIYVDGQKCKIILDGIPHSMILYSLEPITNGIKLLSYDNLTLKDINNIYITAKESE